MTTQEANLPAGEAGRFIALASSRWEAMTAAWKQKAEALAANLAIPSLVLDSEILAERGRILRLFDEAWQAECLLMLGDVSVDLLQFGKPPLGEEELKAIESRQKPDLDFPFAAPPDPNVSPIVGGAAAGALAGAGFAGIGALPGAVIGAIGGMMYGGHSYTSEVREQIQRGIALGLESTYVELRAGKLKFVEQLLELRWRNAG